MGQESRRHTLFVSAAQSFGKTIWQPSVDVYQLTDGWLLKYELAGILPDEIQLAVKGHTVALRGMRRDVSIEQRLRSHRMEISYSHFERTLDLPCELDEMDVKTDYRDGMLTVRLTCKAP